MQSLLNFVAFCSVLALPLLWFATYGKLSQSKRAQRLPPGPKPFPFLGNIHQLPSERLQDTLTKWGAQYGDILYARFFRTQVLIINSLQVAQDLMVKRSAKYSGRPYSVLYSELMGWDTIVSNMTYGERFRKHRKWIHEFVQDKQSLIRYRSMQQREARILIEGLKTTRHDFVPHIQRFASALIMEVAYGHTVTSPDDKYIEIVETALRMTSEAGVQGAMMVDFFPIMKYMPKWMPGAGFKRNALRAAVHVRRMLDTPMEMVKNRMASGTAGPSLAAALIEQAASNGSEAEDQEDIKGAAAVLYGAASITTASVLSTFVLAMVLHPKVYEKAQQELDRFLDSKRLPVLDDREFLPYLECVLREVYRWNVPLPLGLPHSVMADDEYLGYHIPNGAMVLLNISAMSRDPVFYPEPEVFRPERYEEMDRDILEQRDPRKFVFGFGRRACPGLQFADMNVWLAIASMVATLDIRKALDGAGNEITPTASFSGGPDSHPEPFICDIRERATINTIPS